MNYLYLYIALSVGAVIGFGICAILSAGKDRAIFTVDNVVKWLKMGNHNMDKTIYLIVRRVYEGKRTIHKNPIKKKPADKYPVSER